MMFRISENFLQLTWFMLGLTMLATACAATTGSGRSTATPAAGQANSATNPSPVTVEPEPTRASPTIETEPRLNRRVEVPEFDPYPVLLPFDGIPPIYEPEFVKAAEAPLDEEELVLAVAIGQQAKAYPISVLRSREMVNDELAGVPILATW